MKKQMLMVLAGTLGITAAFCPLKSAVAESVRGASKASKMVPSRASDVYSRNFYGGERARVTAIGEGDIDLLVYDENGALVAQDVDGNEKPSVQWTPRRTGYYTIKVRNCEYRAVDYTMFTN